MSSYLSYKGIQIALQSYAIADPNIESFGFGQIYDINGQPKAKQVYPSMWVSPISSTPVIGQHGMLTVNRNYQILFFDTKLADGSNELQVISDCEELAFRFIRWSINAQDPEINILTNPTITPFTDKFLDDVAGVILDVTIEFSGDNDNCSDPLAVININYV